LRYLFEDYALDTERRELRRGQALVAIEPKVFDLLAFVIENRQRVVSRDDLIAQVWDGRIVSESALARCISEARSAIADDGERQRLIKTLPRKGLRFVGVVREERQPSEVAEAGLGAEKPAPALALPERPSIAVLPLDNLSGDMGQDYFCDGITDDIITELSRFSELFVIARNSSFQYKGKAIDVRQVGRDLGVRYILQGSIRRVGDRVRISVQLADARRPSLGRALRPPARGRVRGSGRGGPHRRGDPRCPCEQGGDRALAEQAAGDLAGVRLLPSCGRCPRLLLVVLEGDRSLRGASPLGADPRDRPQLRARLRRACRDPSFSLAPLAGW
jgi:TolB-like protein